MNYCGEWGLVPSFERVRGGAYASAAVFLWLVISPLLWAVVPVTAAASPVVENIRFFTAPEHTRIVLDLSAPVVFEVRRVENPDRLAINIGGAVLAGLQKLAVDDGLLKGIRSNQGARRAQVVLDLESGAAFKSFSLAASNGHRDRIVIDVMRPEATPNGDQMLASQEAMALVKPTVVIIDPGHGGLDPGAIRQGISEKDVTLDIAREMARLINNMPGYRAHLTRNGDYFRELWQRVEYARTMNGDVFLSIHCNTNKKSHINGMEVYFLSLAGATDREAQELADTENAAQMVGLDPADGNSEWVMGILMDLHMTQVLNESARLSHHIVDAGQASGVVKGRKVKQAGFQVLKSLAMPSALIEVAYMSNHDDMNVLQQRQGRMDLAAAVVKGVSAWHQDQPAVLQIAETTEGSWSDRYHVRRGDSLWGLAKRHGTTVTEITRHNNLRSGSINVGQVLQLPGMRQTP